MPIPLVVVAAISSFLSLVSCTLLLFQQSIVGSQRWLAAVTERSSLPAVEAADLHVLSHSSKGGVLVIHWLNKSSMSKAALIIGSTKKVVGTFKTESYPCLTPISTAP
jgi:hypothetical protein